MLIAEAAGEGWRLWGLLSPVDAGIILLLLANAAIGYWTGFIWQAIRIISLIVSVWVSSLYYPIVNEFLSAQMGKDVWWGTGALVVFLLALLACYLVAFLFRKLVNMLRPEVPDRVLGAVLGLMKGIVLLAIAAFLVLGYARQGGLVRRHVSRSVGARWMARSVTVVGQFLPGTMGQQLKEAPSLD